MKMKLKENDQEEQRPFVHICFIYADDCFDCKRAYNLLIKIIQEEDINVSVRKMYCLDDKTVKYCIDNEIDDIPSCIIAERYKFIGYDSFIEEDIRRCLFEGAY